jgi:hypothetical protein
VETRSRMLGHRHPDTLTAMTSNLAHTWKSQGRDGDAIAMIRCIVGVVTEGDSMPIDASKKRPMAVGLACLAAERSI